MSTSRTPHGVRELKPSDMQGVSTGNSRTPHGVRELKPLLITTGIGKGVSHPARGA